jgi:homogentisate 1,2-dioxygenase
VPSYYRLGDVPPKRHTQFRGPDGALFFEEVFGTEGFSGNYSILYHRTIPAQLSSIERLCAVPRATWKADQRNHHLHTGRLDHSREPISGRTALLFNDDLVISLLVASAPQRSLYKNGTRDELVFIHEGSGALRTQFGELQFSPGDYLYLPRGTVQQLDFAEGQGRALVLESSSPIATPRRYRNDQGQLLEHAPYWERDFRKPEPFAAPAQVGPTDVQVKIGDELYRHQLDHDPFDVVGWDGYCYPFAFNIHDFEPIAGRLHVPPTSHQTFEATNFVVCSFVPRKTDWDPDAVPIPYYHSNLDSDEVIYYVSGTYGARKVEPGSLTLHPRGLIHGPSVGAVEASLTGPRETDEVAVMIDTFRPLHLTEACQPLDDPDYMHSWG